MTNTGRQGTSGQVHRCLSPCLPAAVGTLHAAAFPHAWRPQLVAGPDLGPRAGQLAGAAVVLHCF